MKRTVMICFLVSVILACYLPSITKTSKKQESNTEVASTTTMESTYVPATDVTADPTASTTEINSSTIDDYCYRGNIFDRNGSVLMFTADDKRLAADATDEPFANLLSDISAVKADNIWGRDDYRNHPEDPAYLRQKNPTSVHVGDVEDNIYLGQSIVLTLDAESQTKAYTFLKDHNYKGCVLQMDEDGAIRTAASFPSFSHNSYVKGEGKEMVRDAANNQCFISNTPGSVFKLISATIAKKHGYTQLQDPGFLPQFKIKNWDYAKHPERYPVLRGITELIRNSSNCGFAQIVYELGADAVTKDLDDYCFFQEMNIDGITITQSADMSSNGSLARCGFGQRVSVSPVYMGAAALGAVSGTMPEPYLIDWTCDTVTHDKIAQVGEKKVLSDIPMEFTEELREGMLGVTEDLGLAFEGRTIYTKTGTAEINHSGYTDILTVLCVLTDEQGHTQTLILVVQNPDDHGLEYASGLSQNMQDLMELLVE